MKINLNYDANIYSENLKALKLFNEQLYSKVLALNTFVKPLLKPASYVLQSQKPILIILGLGLGYELKKILEQLPNIKKLIIIQPSLELFKESLSAFDWSNLLESKKVALFIAEDIDHFKVYIRQKNILFFQDCQLIQPFIYPDYDDDLLRKYTEDFEAIKKRKINKLQEEYALKEQSILRQQSINSKSQFKIMMFIDERQNVFQRMHILALNAFRKNGFKVDVITIPIDNEYTKPSFTELVYDYLLTGCPSCVFSINYTPQQQCPIFQKLENVQYLTWLLDHPFIYNLNKNVSDTRNHYFLIDPAWQSYLLKNNLTVHPVQHIENLEPISTEIPKPQLAYLFDVSFVGTINNARVDIKAILTKKYSQAQVKSIWADLYDLLLNSKLKTDLYLVYLTLNEKYNLAEKFTKKEISSLFYEINLEFSAHWRLKCLSALTSQNLGFYGNLALNSLFPVDEYKEVLSLFRGPLERSQAGVFFQQSKLNLCIRKIQLTQTLIERDWRIMANRATLLTEYFSGIEEFFTPGKDIITYSTPEELLAQTIYYLHNEEKRLELTAANYKQLQKLPDNQSSLCNAVTEIYG